MQREGNGKGFQNRPRKPLPSSPYSEFSDVAHRTAPSHGLPPRNQLPTQPGLTKTRRTDTATNLLLPLQRQRRQPVRQPARQQRTTTRLPSKDNSCMLRGVFTQWVDRDSLTELPNAPLTEWLKNCSGRIPWDRVRHLESWDFPRERCCVCLEDSWVAPRATPCGHAFCLPCIWRCLQGPKASCPICGWSPLTYGNLRPLRFRHEQAPNTTNNLFLLVKKDGLLVRPAFERPLRLTSLGEVSAARVAAGKAPHWAGDSDAKIDPCNPFVYGKSISRNAVGIQFSRVLINDAAHLETLLMQDAAALAAFLDEAISDPLSANDDPDRASAIRASLESILALLPVGAKPGKTSDLKEHHEKYNIIDEKRQVEEVLCKLHGVLANAKNPTYSQLQFPIPQQQWQSDCLEWLKEWFEPELSRRRVTSPLFYQSATGELQFLDHLCMVRVMVNAVLQLVPKWDSGTLEAVGAFLKVKDCSAADVVANALLCAVCASLNHPLACSALLAAVFFPPESVLVQLPIPLLLGSLKVCHVECSPMNSELRRTCPWLAHIPRGASIQLVDAEVPGCSESANDAFRAVLLGHRKRRQRKAQRTRNRDDKRAAQGQKQRDENFASELAAAAFPSPEMAKDESNRVLEVRGTLEPVRHLPDYLLPNMPKTVWAGAGQQRNEAFPSLETAMTKKAAPEGVWGRPKCIEAASSSSVLQRQS